jgi:hypothetical protein
MLGMSAINEVLQLVRDVILGSCLERRSSAIPERTLDCCVSEFIQSGGGRLANIADSRANGSDDHGFRELAEMQRAAEVGMLTT